MTAGRNSRGLCGLLLLGCIGLTGCSSEPIVVDVKVEPTHERLMYIGSAYRRFFNDNSRAPSGPIDLKSILKESGNPDEILRSARDNEPFVICWGINLGVPPTAANSLPVMAYEKRGVGGSRYVLSTRGMITQMNDADFKQASFPPGHQPPQ